MPTVTTTLFVIDWPTHGRLAVMPRPAGGDQLRSEVAALRQAGVDIVVCALTTDECRGLELTEEARLVRDSGMSFVAFPIVDRDVPGLAELRELAACLAAEVMAGRFVVAHCWGGIGRSSVIASAVLMHLGASAAEAMAHISAVRGLPVPETQPQRELLLQLAETLRPRERR